MQYRADKKSGNNLSILGLGCMRFPRSVGLIDSEKTAALVKAAVDGGVNYFDTAYIYPGSEQALGAALEKHKLRDKIYIASKLPVYKIKSSADPDRIFSEQLSRLRTDHIDYYLMHNLSDSRQWLELCELGIERWLADKKASGAIRQIGFSFHGHYHEFCALLEKYPWDFCQIQYNYINVDFQAGQAGLKRAHELGLPVIIMEPLLGGKLAAGLPKAAEKIFTDDKPTLSPAIRALNWLWDQPEVTVALSGMSNPEQLSENIRGAETAELGMLSGTDHAMYERVQKIFGESYKVNCTGCGYCMPCPMGVNIPSCFAAYNLAYVTGKLKGLALYYTSVAAPDPRRSSAASLCVKCKKCEKLCPQKINISAELENVKKFMEPWYIRSFVKIAKRGIMGKSPKKLKHNCHLP